MKSETNEYIPKIVLPEPRPEQTIDGYIRELKRGIEYSFRSVASEMKCRIKQEILEELKKCQDTEKTEL